MGLPITSGLTSKFEVKTYSHVNRTGARQFIHTSRTKTKTRHFVQKRNQTFRTKPKPDISYKNETRHFVQFILYNLLL